MSGKLVLITGITGYIAGHVANQFLAAGYRVRGTTRGAKAKQLSDTIHVKGLEFIQVDDLANDDLTETLKGVYAVIHVASPLPGRTSVDDTFKSAVSGTRNILDATVKAGIEKVVITATWGSIMDPSLSPSYSGKTLSAADWGSVSREEAEQKADDPFYVYLASKLLAEKAIWEFADKHPQLDIATILPTFVFGPYADPFPLPAGPAQLGSNRFIYRLVSGDILPQTPPYIVDVRDVGKAHLLALDVPRRPIGVKRYLVNGGVLIWRDAITHLNKVRPTIKTALPDAFPALADLPGPLARLDLRRTDEDLKFETWISPEDAVVAAADAIVALQETWKA